MASKTELIELLYSALGLEHGLAVQSDNPKGLRTRLYKLMKEENIGLRLTIMEDELWITKRGDKDENQAP